MRVLILLVAFFSANGVWGANYNVKNPIAGISRPIVGPDWTRQFIEQHYNIRFLPAGLTEAQQILVNESWLGGVANLIYTIHDKSDPIAIRAAAQKCRRLHDTWEQIVCASKAGEDIGYANPNFDVSGLCRALALAFRSVIHEIGNPNVFVGQISIIALDRGSAKGSIWGHNLNLITVRSVSGMTYGYAIDDESLGGAVVIYPLSLTAVQFAKQHGRVLPQVADF